MTILNGTSKPAELEVARYAEILGGKKQAVDIMTGRKVAVDRNIHLSPRQTLIVEL